MLSNLELSEPTVPALCWSFIFSGKTILDSVTLLQSRDTTQIIAGKLIRPAS